MNLALTDAPQTVLNEHDREQAFAHLLSVVEARRDEFDRTKRVPRDVVQIMKQCGIYRSSTPVEFGGDEMAPHKFLAILEKIARVDGSTAWVAAFGSANTYYAALPVETQAIIYADSPDQVFAGALYPPHKAQRVEGGWSITGRWRFASGSPGADWLSCGIIDEASPDGTVLIAVAPADEFEIIENWDVMGMQGTGSHDIALKAHFISDAWTAPRASRATVDGKLYRYPPLAYQAQVHAACNLGMARAAIDIAIGMSGATKIMPGSASLINRGYFKMAIARAEAALRGARAFFFETAEEAWDVINRGDELSLELRTLLRLSATNAAHGCADAVQQLYRSAGMGAAFKSNRMQQILRDSLVVTQHAALSEITFEHVGGTLAGAPPPTEFLS